jgi:hypothetical protein
METGCACTATNRRMVHLGIDGEGDGPGACLHAVPKGIVSIS